MSEAQALLRFLPNSAAEPFQKTVKSAVANAAQNSQLEESNLYIAKIAVDEGPKLKRHRPRARGRAFPIQKKTSHITLVLDELVPGAGTANQEKKVKAGSGDAAKREEKSVSSSKPKFRASRQRKSDTGQPKRDAGVKRIFRRKAI